MNFKVKLCVKFVVAPSLTLNIKALDWGYSLGQMYRKVTLFLLKLLIN